MASARLMFVLVAYDVPSRRTEVFRKLLARFLTHEQNSVFMGRITESVHRAMLAEIAAVTRPAERIVTIVAENQNNVTVSTLRKNEANGILEILPVDAHQRGFDII